MSYFIKILQFRRTDQPQPVYKAALNLWEAFRYPPIGDAERNVSERVLARAPLDVRLTEFRSPQPIFKAALNLFEAERYASIGDAERNVSPRTEARPRLELRHNQWQPQVGWLPAVVDRQTATWSPAFAPAPSYRMADRASASPRVDPVVTSWIAASITAAPTVAQQWPAIQFGTVQPRTIDTRVLDVRQNWPQVFGTPEDATAPQQVPIWQHALGHERTPDPVRLDVRRQTSADVSWIVATFTTAPTVAQQWPAVLHNLPLSYRSGGRQALDVRQQWPQAFGTPEDATAPQQVPIWQHAIGHERTPERYSLDVRRQTAADISWISATFTTSTVAQQSAVWQHALGRDRMAPGVAFDVRRHGSTSDISWISTTFVVPATVAQQWPAVLLGLQPSYRSGARPSLDVRNYEWAPEQGWVRSSVDRLIAPWAPIWTMQLQAMRSRERARLDLTRAEWAPQFGWLRTSLPLTVAAASAHRMLMVPDTHRALLVPRTGRTLMVPTTTRRRNTEDS